MKKSLLMAFAMFGLLFSAIAQSTVTGTVKDDSGESLPGATVTIKGTTTGTVTDIDGKYSLQVPSAESVLVFSFSGMQEQEVIVGTKTVIDVALSSDILLDEVVVSALGIKQSKDQLGTASSKVSGDAISKSPATDMLGGMAGKAAGLQIQQAGGGPGDAQRIQIRGASTITGNLTPLVVVNGIPISNSTLGNNTGNDGGVAQQSRINDINPNDIESVEVLKGASAAALWG